MILFVLNTNSIGVYADTMSKAGLLGVLCKDWHVCLAGRHAKWENRIFQIFPGVIFFYLLMMICRVGSSRVILRFTEIVRLKEHEYIFFFLFLLPLNVEIFLTTITKNNACRYNFLHNLSLYHSGLTDKREDAYAF